MPISDSFSFRAVTVVATVSISAYFVYRKIVEPLHYFEQIGIPGPAPIAFLGNLPDLEEGIHVAHVALREKYGKVFGLVIGRKPQIVVCDINILQRILIDDFDQFCNRRGFQLLPYENLKYGVNTLRDNEWRRVRSILAPVFSRNSCQEIVPIIEKSCNILLIKLLQASYTEQALNISNAMGQFATEITMVTLFGQPGKLQTSVNVRPDELTTAINSIFRVPPVASLLVLAVPPLSSYLLKINSTGFRFLETVCHQAIKQKRERIAKNMECQRDLLQLMMEAGSDGKLTDTDIVSQSLTYLLTSYHPLKNGLCFLMYLITTHKEVQDKLIREIDENLPNRQLPTLNEITKLAYLDAVIKETLRLYPATFIYHREAARDCTINGFFFPKEVTIAVPVYAIHRDPEIWPNPSSFRPERFLSDTNATRHPCSYLPFGVGARACMAANFVTVIFKIMLIVTLRSVKFKVVPETEIPLATTSLASLQPMYDVYLGIERRQYVD